MTLESWVKKQVAERFKKCIQSECPPDVGLMVRDHMQHTKGQPPAQKIYRQHQLIAYFVSKIVEVMDAAPVSVHCYDKRTPEVKKMVCHEKRYERRCPVCIQRGELPVGRRAGEEFFDPKCDKGCKDNQILWFEDGPYLGSDPDTPVNWLVADWGKFSADSRNLWYDLYPLIVNALLELPIPHDRVIFINGLPFNTEVVDEVDPKYASGHLPTTSDRSRLFKKRVVVAPWTQTALEDLRKTRGVDELLNRTYLIDATRKGVEMPEMYNTIHEADNAIFFYSRFFPDRHRVVSIINDGDAISIGLFRALEDIRGPDTVDHEQWLCLPVLGKDKPKKKSLFAGTSDGYTFWNLTKMCQEIEKMEDYVNAGVQSPVATLVFLIVLTGTDFFNKHEFCFGIGKDTVVWEVFRQNMSTYRHMVQYYPIVKDPTVQRRVVFDEALFRIFCHACYVAKHGEPCKNKRRGKKRDREEEEEVDADEVRIYCSAFKDPRKHVPSDELIQRFLRQIDWNVNYWANAFRNIYIDPFTEYNGLPYYGYKPDMTIVNVVASKQMPVDEREKRNFYKRKQKEPIAPIPESNKRAALDSIRGK